MKICWQRFNLYLFVALGAAVVCGCRTSSDEVRPKKLLSTLRLHLEASRDGTKSNELVPIYREKPVMVNVEIVPFLTEADVAKAEVIDVVGGFALRIQFKGQGAGLLEEFTTANRGRRIAVFSQFGDKIKNNRWLAAPIITRSISDGIFTFTPDATREELEEIAIGLNNVAKKLHSWIDD